MLALEELGVRISIYPLLRQDEAIVHAEAARLLPRACFLSFLSRQEQVAHLLRRSDVLVAPSVHTIDGRREGIPGVIMEAMATGLPVVASRISGIPELVHDGANGLLVAPRDPQTLADAIRGLYEDPELCRRLDVSARDTVVRGFDIQSTAQNLAELIIAPH